MYSGFPRSTIESLQIIIDAVATSTSSEIALMRSSKYGIAIADIRAVIAELE
jgi:hypothetical protein